AERWEGKGTVAPALTRRCFASPPSPASRARGNLHRSISRSRKTPAQAPLGDSRGSVAERLGLRARNAELVLGFALSCRCQGVGNPLQPGGVMLYRHPPRG